MSGLRSTSAIAPCDVLGGLSRFGSEHSACAEYFDSQDSPVRVEVDGQGRVLKADTSNSRGRDFASVDLIDQVHVGGVGFGIVGHAHDRIITCIRTDLPR